jgi:uncharacterized membrane protein YoaK (UPF0700 family)
MTESASRHDIHHRVVLPVLIVLTAVTGIVDAVSFLGLGQVFVAVMTGNIVFAGLALGGAAGLALFEPLVALAAFVIGCLVGGRIIAHFGEHRGHVLIGAVSVKLVCALSAVAVAALFAPGSNRVARMVMIVLMAGGMAVQTTGVRYLAVRDFTTTLATMAIVGMAAESRLAGGRGGLPLSRLVSVFALLGGALVGGLLVTQVGVAWPMGVVALLLIFVLGALGLRLRNSVAEDWLEPRHQR